MNSQQFDNSEPARAQRMTEQETQAVIALWQQEQMEQGGLTNQPALPDVAEGLDISVEDARRLLEQVRSQRRRKKSCWRGSRPRPSWSRSVWPRKSANWPKSAASAPSCSGKGRRRARREIDGRAKPTADVLHELMTAVKKVTMGFIVASD